MVLSGVSRKDFAGRYKIQSPYKEFSNYASKLVMSHKICNSKKILRRLEALNAKHNYQLKTQKMIKIADNAMTDITEKKKRFHTMMLEIKWGNITQLKDSDPAKIDPELERKLKMNHNHGNRRLQDEMER